MSKGNNKRINFAADEEWRPIPYPGYEKYYAVSNRGKVMRMLPGRTGNTHPGKLLKSTTVHTYERLNLSNNKSNSQFSLSRTVALAFLGKPLNKDKNQVNHKDMNKKNNGVDNLEWVTNAENRRHYDEWRKSHGC